MNVCARVKQYLRAVALLTSVLVTSGPAIATVVVEKDLEALSTEADLIFVGTVSAVQSQWADPWEDHIETLVTLTDIEPLHQTDTPEVVLRFSGGQVKDVVERVQGMPRFAVGDRFVIFARDELSVSPVVGFHQGCLPVKGVGQEATVSIASYSQVGTHAGRTLVAGAASSVTTVLLRDFIADVDRYLSARETGP